MKIIIHYRESEEDGTVSAPASYEIVVDKNNTFTLPEDFDQKIDFVTYGKVVFEPTDHFDPRIYA